MVDAFKVVRQFEQELRDYTHAPYAVTVNSCTNALFLSLLWASKQPEYKGVQRVKIPSRTYVSVPMQIKHAGFIPVFENIEWRGGYRLDPFRIWDSARRFTSGMYIPRSYMCVSFHWSKILGIQQGGAILHDDYLFDGWARRMRFDGRTEGIPPKDDSFSELGYHMYMSPEIAAEGLVRLSHLQLNNSDLPNDDYPDLSKIELFK